MPADAPVRGPQPIHVPAHPDPSDGHARLYTILREGRAATERWNAAYIARHGLGPLLAQLEAERVGLPSARPAVDEEPAPEPAPPPAVTLAVATDDHAPVICECGLTVLHGGYLPLHRAGDVHHERMVAWGARTA